MNVEIITIGDELLIGQVVDTNSAWMGRELNKQGMEVMRITSVRDRATEMCNAFDEAFARVEVVLVTGGLGPTKDDVTKDTLCRYFGGEMVFDDAVYLHLVRLLQERGISLNESTKGQCYVPSSCKVLQNSVGTAPIMWFEKDGKVLVSMPGVPSEMIEAMQQQVMPRLQTRLAPQHAIEHYTCLVHGYTESALSEYLAPYEAALPAELSLAYLPTPRIVRLRLTARCHTVQQCRVLLQEQSQRLAQQLQEHLLCEGDLTLAELLGELLQQKNYTLATAESCTGGNIAHQITATAGASAWYNGSVVAYANSAKEQLLGVSPQHLEAYGAVSQPVVEQMARGVQQQLGTTCAIATSGIAGPTGGTPEKPVGTVWIAVAIDDEVQSMCYKFGGNRTQIVERATSTALLTLIERLK